MTSEFHRNNIYIVFDKELNKVIIIVDIDVTYTGKSLNAYTKCRVQILTVSRNGYDNNNNIIIFYVLFNLVS